MYRPAPRCSMALLSTWVLAGSRPPWPPAANAVALTTRPNRIVLMRRIGERALVMHGHPFRHRLGLLQAEVRVDEQEDEVAEIQDGKHAPDLRLRDVGTRTGADLAQPDEAD